MADLVRELMARLGDLTPDRPSVRLLWELRRRLDVLATLPDNRFAPAHLQELLGTYWFWARQPNESLAGKVCLELGAGAEAPLTVAAALVMLGAERAYGLELTPPLSAEAQAQAIADAAYWLSVRHDLFAKLELAPLRAAVQQRVAAFDLGALAAGRLELPPSVRMLVASAASTGLPSASVDRVVSSSFLEHVDDPAAVVAEIRRITAPGGVSLHNIDTADHRHYRQAVASPVAFLLEQPGAATVDGCNRLRIDDFVRLFAAADFTLVRRIDYQTHAWTPEELAARVPPFRDQPTAELAPLKSVLWFRLPEGVRNHGPAR